MSGVTDDSAGSVCQMIASGHSGAVQPPGRVERVLRADNIPASGAAGGSTCSTPASAWPPPLRPTGYSSHHEQRWRVAIRAGSRALYKPGAGTTRLDPALGPPPAVRSLASVTGQDHTRRSSFVGCCGRADLARWRTPMKSRDSVQVIHGDLSPGLAATLGSATRVACDVETSGLDWRHDRLGTCQLFTDSAGPVVVSLC